MEIIGIYINKTQNRSISNLFWAAATGSRDRIWSELRVSRSYGIEIMSQPNEDSSFIRPERFRLCPRRTPEKYDTDLIWFVRDRYRTLALCNGPGRWITALHWAVIVNDVKLLDFMLKAGTHVDCRDSFGYTALHMAVVLHKDRIARTLLEWEANVEAKAHISGRTPLDEARLVHKLGLYEKEALLVIWLLLENGNDRNWRDADGVPLLHLAVIYGHEVLVKDLLDNRGGTRTTTVEIRGRDGKYELHAGTGAVDVDVRDKQGRTALDVARLLEKRSICELLERNGGNPQTNTI